MTKKKIKVELVLAKMGLQEALREFPGVDIKLLEFQQIKPNPRNPATMNRRERAYTRLEVLIEETTADLRAQSKVLERLNKSTTEFFEVLKERQARNPRVLKTNPRYPAYMEEKGQLAVLTRLCHSDLTTLNEEYKKHIRKLDAWHIIQNEFIRITKQWMDELKAQTRWIKERTAKTCSAS